MFRSTTLVFALTFLACSLSNKRKSSLESVSESQLSGKWQAEDDVKLSLLFLDSSAIEVYDNDTTDIYSYKLSDTCSIHKKHTTDFPNNRNSNVFILFLKKSEIEKCTEILSLNQKILTLMHTETGRIFVYKRS
jgi:hypothetical protein